MDQFISIGNFLVTQNEILLHTSVVSANMINTNIAAVCMHGYSNVAHLIHSNYVQQTSAHFHHCNFVLHTVGIQHMQISKLLVRRSSGCEI